MTDAYGISGVLPEGAVDSLEPGTNVAVIGPSFGPKREIALGLLAAGYRADDGILCITTSSTKRVFADLERHIPDLDQATVGVIDCAGIGTDEVFAELTESVSSPGDLTGISIGTAKLSKRFRERGIGDIRYGLVSVSTLLQYVDSSTVFRFLHVFTNRVNETDGLGIYTLDDDTHDRTTVNTIRGQFDTVIELREAADGGEYRVRGLGRATNDWSPLE